MYASPLVNAATRKGEDQMIDLPENGRRRRAPQGDCYAAANCSGVFYAGKAKGGTHRKGKCGRKRRKQHAAMHA
jgi:hypothetical protein